jgi:type 1 fimbria pilin
MQRIIRSLTLTLCAGMKKTVWWVLLLGSGGSTWAACMGDFDRVYDFSFGDIIVQRDAPVGTLLAAAEQASPNGVNGCDTAWIYQAVMRHFLTRSGLTDVYNTNIAGVGIRITAKDIFSARHPDSLFNVRPNVYYPPSVYRVELVKTLPGPVSSGPLDSARVALFCRYLVHCLGIINLANTRIIPVACGVTHNPPPVFLGDTLTTEFSGSGSYAREVPISIPLDCTAQTRVHITLEGASAGPGLPGVLALNNAADSGTAKGIGVQLLLEDRPVTLGSQHLVGTTTSDGTYHVNLVARYYQTHASLTGGVANSTATFTLSYQ